MRSHPRSVSRRDRLPPGAFVHSEPSPARSARSSKHALNREECVGCGRRLPAHVPLALQRIVLESVSYCRLRGGRSNSLGEAETTVARTFLIPGSWTSPSPQAGAIFFERRRLRRVTPPNDVGRVATAIGRDKNRWVYP